MEELVAEEREHEELVEAEEDMEAQGCLFDWNSPPPEGPHELELTGAFGRLFTDEH